MEGGQPERCSGARSKQASKASEERQVRGYCVNANVRKAGGDGRPFWRPCEI